MKYGDVFKRTLIIGALSFGILGVGQSVHAAGSTELNVPDQSEKNGNNQVLENQSNSLEQLLDDTEKIVDDTLKSISPSEEKKDLQTNPSSSSDDNSKANTVKAETTTESNAEDHTNAEQVQDEPSESSDD